MQCALPVAIIALAMVGPAQAQPNDSSAIADRLFNEGRDLIKENHWAEACPKFEASLQHDRALGTQLNLATCYEHIGKLAAAWDLYRESIALATKAGDVERRNYAQQQASALERRLPRLAISAPRTPPAGFVVTRDGKRLEPGELGVAVYVDPGAHEITASAPGCEAVTRTVALGEGDSKTLAIPDLVSVPGVAPSARKHLALGIGTGGVVAVGIGLLFGYKASSTYSDAKALCGEHLACDPADYDHGNQLIHDARSSATISTVFVAVGVAAIGAGVVVLATTRRAKKHETAQVVPAIHERGAGLVVTGRF